MRIDTGVEEGSEISMYYDPMISKLVTWGKDRAEASRILDRAFDEYVIQGVTHNIGHGKSMLAHEGFASGDYSTAFIPTYYPNGFSGDPLTADDHHLLSIVTHNIKNIHLNQGSEGDKWSEDTLYISIQALQDHPAVDLKVTKLNDSEYEVTNVETNST